jgi:hypothetical protein
MGAGTGHRDIKEHTVFCHTVGKHINNIAEKGECHKGSHKQGIVRQNDILIYSKAVNANLFTYLC